MKNRELKFRAWDIKENKMIPSVGITSDGTVFTMRSVSKVRIGDELKTQNADCVAYMNDEVQLMQYTGLKDEGDREIYEGDIVIWEACSCEVRFGFHTAAKSIAISSTEIKAYGFYLYFYGMKCDDPIDGYVGGNCRIIGNIYENPDLARNK